jgi:hypothetical protein
MVNNCANSGCAKPLHYLREGRIYIFDLSLAEKPPAGVKRLRRLEHYWLCGTCAETLMMIQDAQGTIHVMPKPAAIRETDEPLTPPLSMPA